MRRGGAVMKGLQMEFLANFASWLGATPIATLVTSRSWIVPAIQVVHIIAISTVVIACVEVNLRAIRSAEDGPDLPATLCLWLPVTYAAIAVLAVSSALLIASEPGRALFRTVFWVKLVLLTIAVLATRAHGRSRGQGNVTQRRLLAAASVILWVGVIYAGRWIAYADGWPGAPS